MPKHDLRLEPSYSIATFSIGEPVSVMCHDLSVTATRPSV